VKGSGPLASAKQEGAEEKNGEAGHIENADSDSEII